MRFLGIQCILFGVTIAGCAPRGDPPAAADSALDTSGCEEAPNWWECARQREHALVATLGDVRRAGDTLVIDIPGAVPVVLADSVAAAGDYEHQYLYQGAVAGLNAHLVQVLWYEGRGFLLVSRSTGRRTPLDAPPVLSPAGARIVTASWDTEAGYDPNRVQVFRLVADSLVLEWQREPESWGPVEPRWLDDATLLIRRRPAVWHPDSTQLRRPLVLRRQGTAWTADST